jgi:carboxyl-terminal processing protease
MNGKKTGYISLPMFYVDPQNPQGAHCSADVYKLLLRLKEAKIDDLVIDLRDNPGGSLDEVASMASLFIDKGPVVQLKNKENIQTYSKNEGTAIYSGPMAVLVNGNSASASEIFAAAMQDYKRAVIIGCNTYGKGTAQENLVMGKVADRIHNRPAMNFGAMRLSIKKIYRVTGSSTQVKGVTPDLMLPDPLDYTYVRETNMPFAMPWDTVAASPFKTWDTVCSPAILQKAREQVGRDSAFAIIHENTEWLKQNLKGPYSLEPEKLAEQMKAVDNHVARINEAKKMAPSDNITIQDPPPAKDNEKDGAASAVVAAKDGAANDPIKYNKWLDQIKSDIYIHQAISVINEMINKSK